MDTGNINEFTLISNIELEFLELGYNISPIIGVVTRIETYGLNPEVRRTLAVCILDNFAGRSIRVIFWNPNNNRCFEELVVGQIVSITGGIINETNGPKFTPNDSDTLIRHLIIHVTSEDTVVHWLGMMSSQVRVSAGRAVVERVPRSHYSSSLPLATWGEAGRSISHNDDEEVNSSGRGL